MTGPRGIRNNNPMNIRESAIAWKGEVDGPDPEFEAFESPMMGIRAGCKLLLTYYRKHKIDTVRGIINRWAPPVENDTRAYMVDVALRTGLGLDNQLNVEDPAVLSALAIAIIRHENGDQPYPAQMVMEAAKEALA